MCFHHHVLPYRQRDETFCQVTICIAMGRPEIKYVSLSLTMWLFGLKNIFENDPFLTVESNEVCMDKCIILEFIVRIRMYVHV